MTVVTLCTELGAVDEHFVTQLARSLGTDIVDHRLFERYILDCMDASDGEVFDLVKGQSTMSRHWDMNTRQLARQTSEEILEVAARGNVLIISSAAAAVLRPIRHVLSLRVRAPLDVRLHNVMQRLAYSDVRMAQWEIESVDAAHARYMRRVFDIDWQSPDLYDLVLNTERVPLAQWLEPVRHLARSAQFDVTPASYAALCSRQRALQVQDTEHTVRTVANGASLPAADVPKDAIAAVERRLRH